MAPRAAGAEGITRPMAKRKLFVVVHGHETRFRVSTARRQSIRSAERKKHRDPTIEVHQINVEDAREALAVFGHLSTPLAERGSVQRGAGS